MIEAAMIWNEPNNKSHWDPELDPDWRRFAEMAVKAGQAIHAANPGVIRVLGGISPIDPVFITNLESRVCSIPSTRSACTDFLSIGIYGRSMTGPPSSKIFAP